VGRQRVTRFGKRYLHLNTGGDEYVGFIVNADRADVMIAMAKDAGIEASLEGVNPALSESLRPYLYML
jgi:hypothetical protein